jgi:WD40 repeat protein
MLSAMATHNGLIAAINLGGILAVWDATTLALRASARVAHTLEMTSMALGGLHGRTVVLGGTDGGAIRWFDSADLTELTPPGRFTQHTSTAGHTVDAMNWPAPGAVTHLRVTDRTVFSAAGDTVTSADITTGEPAGPALVHPGRIRAMSPTVLDGVPVIATSCDDRILRVWEITTGRTLRAVTLPRTVHRILSVTTSQIIVLDSGYLIAAAAPQDTHHIQ